MRRPQSALCSCVSAVLAAAVLALVPSVATAATTVSKVGSVVTITGDDTASRLVAPFDSTDTAIQDELPGGIVTPGPGCFQDGPDQVACGIFAATDTIVANLGGGDDYYKRAITIDVAQTIDAGPGNDTIETGNGKDTVRGGTGNDDLAGGRGDDTVDGGDGDDKVDGWDGSDTVIGGAGRDNLLGDGGTLYAGGNDKLFARDGEPDSVDCGGGADAAEVDTADVVSACTSVDRTAQNAPGTTPGTPPSGPGATPPSASSELTLAGGVTKLQTPRALAKGKKITLTLTANATCTGAIAIAVSKREAKRLKLGKKELTLGTSKAITFKAGAATEIGVAVDRKYRAKLARASKLKTSLAIVCTDAAERSYLGGLELELKK